MPGLARKTALAAHAHDALLVDRQGHITEGSNCNVFVVIDQQLIAPPAGTILEGTVMARTLALATELEISCRRHPLAVADLHRWDEAFLTSTRRGILPIRQVDEQPLSPNRPITQRLMAAYEAWEAEVLA